MLLEETLMFCSTAYVTHSRTWILKPLYNSCPFPQACSLTSLW